MVQRITVSPQQYQGTSIALTAQQVHYLVRVLRLKVGDRFIAQDGSSQQWLAALTAQLELAEVVETLSSLHSLSPTPPLRLIAALPKGNSFDQVVRQSTELGVTHIYPVFSERSLLKPSDHKLARWQKIAQEAAEQSERLSVPNIFAPVGFQQCLAQADWAGLRYICVARSHGSSTPSTSAPLSAPLSTLPNSQSAHLLTHLLDNLTSADSPSVTLAVGPEGGWTTEEITVANRYHYKSISLGSAILRAVTAPITALSLVAAARELLI